MTPESEQVGELDRECGYMNGDRSWASPPRLAEFSKARLCLLYHAPDSPPRDTSGGCQCPLHMTLSTLGKVGGGLYRSPSHNRKFQSVKLDWGVFPVVQRAQQVLGYLDFVSFSSQRARKMA